MPSDPQVLMKYSMQFSVWWTCNSQSEEKKTEGDVFK